MQEFIWETPEEIDKALAECVLMYLNIIGMTIQKNYTFTLFKAIIKIYETAYPINNIINANR